MRTPASAAKLLAAMRTGDPASVLADLTRWIDGGIPAEEGKARSSYRFPSVGELHFVRDADASDPLVMLASLVGKYVRELFMSRIAGHYPGHDDPSLPRSSGYHDPVTAGFVDRTALLRKRRRMPDHCFERDRDPPGPKLAESSGLA